MSKSNVKIQGFVYKSAAKSYFLCHLKVYIMNFIRPFKRIFCVS